MERRSLGNLDTFIESYSTHRDNRKMSDLGRSRTGENRATKIAYVFISSVTHHFLHNYSRWRRLR